MKYEILGGGPIEAATDLELVEAMREQSMGHAPTVGVEDFMEGMAQRAEMHCGHPIRTDSVADFVADLTQHGLITPIL
jgi:hypothetical protein